MRIFRSFKQLLPTEKNLDKTLTQTADINSGCKLDKAAYATKNLSILSNIPITWTYKGT